MHSHFKAFPDVISVTCLGIGFDSIGIIGYIGQYLNNKDNGARK
jgi:hypothetical protein